MREGITKIYIFSVIRRSVVLNDCNNSSVHLVETSSRSQHITNFKYSQWFPPFWPNVVAISVSRESQRGTNTHT